MRPKAGYCVTIMSRHRLSGVTLPHLWRGLFPTEEMHLKAKTVEMIMQYILQEFGMPESNSSHRLGNNIVTEYLSQTFLPNGT